MSVLGGNYQKLRKVFFDRLHRKPTFYVFQSMKIHAQMTKERNLLPFGDIIAFIS